MRSLEPPFLAIAVHCSELRHEPAVAKVVARPTVRERLTAMGLTVGAMSAEQLGVPETAYTAAGSRIIRETGFVPQ